MMLGPDGQKALAPSGATIVGQEFVRDPVALGQVAQSLLDVLPVKQHTSTEYAYLRQTVRTNAAVVVGVGTVVVPDVVGASLEVVAGQAAEKGPLPPPAPFPTWIWGRGTRRCGRGRLVWLSRSYPADTGEPGLVLALTGGLNRTELTDINGARTSL